MKKKNLVQLSGEYIRVKVKAGVDKRSQEMLSISVLYTAEIELRPVIGEVISRKHDPETGTVFWNFE